MGECKDKQVMEAYTIQCEVVVVCAGAGSMYAGLRGYLNLELL
jgi:hypothetical protein